MWRRTGAAPIAGVALAAWLMMLGSGECVCDVCGNVIITRRRWGMVNIIEGPQSEVDVMAALQQRDAFPYD